ncbi:hypothetical protein MWN33_12660 [Starkeya koreensis]|uniref:Uncharacterized protein n=1 Tax=Ancylobacter koreensis TaxID=266121 RepID=A0ABT0DNM5_9HYPH|nr:hypothetical protein [Ancylobacter koreensis]MCK0208882.1 hypothetical protein [Ancylobacter koreensis]
MTHVTSTLPGSSAKPGKAGAHDPDQNTSHRERHTETPLYVSAELSNFCIALSYADLAAIAYMKCTRQNADLNYVFVISKTFAIANSDEEIVHSHGHSFTGSTGRSVSTNCAERIKLTPRRDNGWATGAAPPRTPSRLIIHAFDNRLFTISALISGREAAKGLPYAET